MLGWEDGALSQSCVSEYYEGKRILHRLVAFGLLLLYITPCALSSNSASYLQEGDAALLIGDYSSALQHYSSYIELNTLAPTGYSKRAAVYVQQRKLKEALNDLSKAVEVDPNFIQGYLERAQLLRQSCRYTEAEADYRKVLEADTEHLASRKGLSQLEQAREKLSEAVTAFATGDFQRTQELLDKVVFAFSPDCGKARVLKARLLLKNKDYNGASLQAGFILKQDEGNLEALLVRGQAYFYLGDHDLALRHYQSGLRLDPEHSELKKEYQKLKSLKKKTNNADELLEKGKFRAAIEEYTAALGVAPDHSVHNVKLHLGLCTASLKLGRGKDALVQCNLVLDIDSELLEALVQRAEAKFLLEDWEGALEDFKHAAQKSPQDRSIREGLHKSEKALKLSKRKDWYKVLGLDRSASAADVKRAYKKLALQWHPDKNTDKPDEAEAKFREIAEAYEILGDEDKRGRYDRGEDLEEQHQGGPGFNPFGGPGGQTFTFFYN